MLQNVVPQSWPRPVAAIAFGMVLLASSALFAGGGSPQEPRRGVGTWDPESGLGNHRVVIRVEAVAKPAVVQVRIPWRRRDLAPERKGVIVVDASTGQRVTNVLPLAVTREIGFLLFEPKTVPGDYYVYFMPYKSEGRKNYPNTKYDPPAVTEDPGWMETAKAVLLRDVYATGQVPMADVPSAKVVEIQSVDEFSAFTPMELVATAQETKALLAAHPGAPYLLFPEDRSLSIRMADLLPYRWAASGPAGAVTGRAARGESFTFQVGVWAAREAITDLDVRFSDLILTATGAAGGSAASPYLIPAKDLTCFNKRGTDWDGSPIVKTVPVDAGKIQALWCGIRVPLSAPPGLFKGTLTVAPAGLPETILAVELDVTDEILPDSGDGDPSRMTRLRWLDSTLAQDDEIVPPYTPVTVDRFTVGCLGRTLSIGRDGFPERIRSYFAPEMTRLQAKPVDVTAGPIRLRVIDPDGAGPRLEAEPHRTAPGPARPRGGRLGGRQLQRRFPHAGRGAPGIRRLRRLQGRAHGPSRHRRVRHPARGPLERRRRNLHDGPGLQGRPPPAVLRVGLGPEEEPGRPVDRGGQRRDAGRAAGRELRRGRSTRISICRSPSTCRRRGGTRARAA